MNINLFSFQRIFYLKQLNFLRKSIFNKEDIILFDEAIRCFSKEAYRSSYVMTWICTAESLREKILQLSQKDHMASKAISEIIKVESENGPVDKIIIDKALSLGILTVDEYKKIDHIRDMRNSYAHPLGLSPTIEEVFTTICTITELVLSRPPQLKHGYVSSMLNSVLKDIHYLDDDEGKIKEYGRSIAIRLHKDVVPYLFKKVCDHFENLSTEPVLRRRGRYLVIAILEELRPDFKDSNWNLVSLINKYPKASSIFLAKPVYWDLLPDQAKDMCFGNLIQPIGNNGEVLKPGIVRLSAVIELNKFGLINQKQVEKLDSILEQFAYKELLEMSVPLDKVVTRILKDLKSHNWPRQNSASESLLNFGFEQIKVLSSELQDELGRNILQSAHGDAKSSIQFIRKIKDLEIPEKFLQGLLQECFTNEQKEFRLKDTYLKDVLEICIKSKYCKSIIEKAIKDIDDSTSDFRTLVSCYDRALILIEEMIVGKTLNRNLMKKLKKSIENAKARLEQEVL